MKGRGRILVPALLVVATRVDADKILETLQVNFI